jgi:hypothetical protein
VKNWLQKSYNQNMRNIFISWIYLILCQKIRGYDIMVKPEHVKAHETKSHDEKAQKPKEKQQKPKK